MTDERKHSIDKLFQGALEGQKIDPAAAVWASLKNHIPAVGSQGLARYLLSAVAIGLFSLMISTNVTLDPFVSGINEIAEEQEIIPTEVPDIDLTETEGFSETPVSTDQKSNRAQSAEKSVTTYSGIADPLEETLTPKPLIIEKAEDVRTDIARESALYDFLACRVITFPNADQLHLESFEKRETPSPVSGISLSDGYVKNADVLLGAGLSPAVNIYPDGQNRNDISLEFTAAYERSRFIIESGFGANYTTESAKYGISYSSYDSIGYFINVNSFGTDPSKPDSVWFETSMKGIYDSIDHYRIEEKTNKYTYLQIPIRIGYRILEKERFSIDLRLGVLFSVQLYKDVPDIPYEGNDVNRIDVLRYYPDRLKTNWQYTAGIGMNYQISRQARFSLEPFYRQYIRSVYTSGSDFSARSPYAFGIRGAIFIHF